MKKRINNNQESTGNSKLERILMLLKKYSTSTAVKERKLNVIFNILTFPTTQLAMASGEKSKRVRKTVRNCDIWLRGTWSHQLC